MELVAIVALRYCPHQEVLIQNRIAISIPRHGLSPSRGPPALSRRESDRPNVTRGYRTRSNARLTAGQGARVKRTLRWMERSRLRLLRSYLRLGGTDVWRSRSYAYLRIGGLGEPPIDHPPSCRANCSPIVRGRRGWIMRTLGFGSVMVLAALVAGC